jgi:hypothetical protein
MFEALTDKLNGVFNRLVHVLLCQPAFAAEAVEYAVEFVGQGFEHCLPSLFRVWDGHGG